MKKAGSTTMIPKQITVQPMGKYELSSTIKRERERVIKSLGKNMLILFNGRKGVILTYALYPMARQQNQNIIGR